MGGSILTPKNVVEWLGLLREKGYFLRKDGDKLVVNGPKPRDAAAAVELLATNKAGLLVALSAELNPTIQLAINILGARLIDVVPAPVKGAAK